MTHPPAKNKSQRKTSPPGVPRKAKAPTVASTRWPWWVWLLGVLAITFAVYVPSLDNDFTNWDDNHYVTENLLLARPSLHAILTTPVDGNYHPLTMLSLALNYQLSQLHPASYHWLSLLLHLGNTALVFLFVRSLLGGGLWAPALTSLLFGIHPMHVESVAWISERKDVLYVFFYLIGLLAYLRFLDDRRSTWFFATFLAFILSLASKPSAMVFPVTLLAIDWYRRRPFNLGVLLEKVPYVAVSLVVAVLTLHAQKSVGALTDSGMWTPLQKVLFASYGTVMYVLKLFVPTGLSVIYPYPHQPVGQLGAEFYLSFVALAVLLPTIVFLFRRDRAVLFGLMFFFINLVLVLQFFSIGHAVMADRYTYLPYVGLLFALTYWMDPDGLFADGNPMKGLLGGVLLLLIPVCAYQTWKRCDVWQNSETLWNDTIQKYPRRIPDAYFLRGTYYHHTVGRPEAALADYNEALTLSPKSAIIWANKGTLLSDMNSPDSAYACLNRAIELQPDLALALGNRGAIKGQRGDLPGAIADFTRAIAADPQFRDPYVNRAVAYYMTGNYEKAIADSRRAIELDPTNPDRPALLDAIGLSLQALGRYREAVTEHDAAIREAQRNSDPRIGGYYLNRSLAWRGAGDRDRALSDVKQAQLLGVTGQEAYVRELESAGGSGSTR